MLRSLRFKLPVLSAFVNAYIVILSKVGTGGAPGGGEEEGAAAGAVGSSGTPPSRPLLGRRDSTSFDTSRHVDLFFWLLSYLWRFGLTCLNCRLTSEEVVRLNSGLEHIMDIMGETVSEHVIKTTIVR